MGQRKRFADGKVSLPYRRFLGYEKGPDGLPVIVESEAVIIRLIYRLFLYGKSPSAIATYLTDEGIPTPGGKKVWRARCGEHPHQRKVQGRRALAEEIHGGFPHQKAKGQRGRSAAVLCDEQPSGHYRTGAFRPRTIRAENPQDGWRFTSCLHPFSGRIICGECGGIYGSKVWHSNTENRSLVWQCNEKYRGQHCSTPHLTEDEIKAAFLAAFNIVLGNRDEIIEAYEEVIAALTDTADLDAEQETLENESEVVLGLIQKIISEMRRPPWIRKNTTAGMMLTLSGLKPPGNGWRKSQSFGRNAMPKRQESGCSWKT